MPLLSTKKGYTNAVYGFTTMLLKLLEEEKPTHFLVAFDAGKKTFRHTDYKEYKGKRQKTPSELSGQFPLIRQLLDAFSIKHFELEGYEADDIIGTLTKRAEQQGLSTKVVTGDKDMLQLVSDHVHIALTRKGISEMEHYDLKQLEEKYQLKPNQIIDLKGLMGDASDNIPGVPGVGEKTALKLLHQYGSVEEVYKHLDQVSGKKLKENLGSHKEDAFLSKDLATIVRDAPVDIGLDEMKYEGYQTEKVVPFFKALAFESLIERVGGEAETIQVKELDYKLLTSVEQVEWDKVLASPSALHFEIYEERYHDVPLIGVALRNVHGCFYLEAEQALQSEMFVRWLEDERAEKWMHDAKRSEVALLWKGINVKGITFDTLLAAYLLNPSEAEYPLDRLAQQYGTLQLSSDEQVYGKGAKRKQPEATNELFQHIAYKAEAIFEIKKKLEERLTEDQLIRLLFDVELPLTHILAQMEYEGVRVNKDTLQKMGEELQHRLEELTKEIHTLAGTEFNINSPKQLGEILFEKLQLPVIKKTKTGYSTSADVLEKLEPQHEIISKILLYRQLGKLQSTYIEGLMKEIHPETGKIHTNFQQTIAATGRLSSIDPNLQNIPIRLEEGRKLRKAFIPSKADHLLMAADYSQIELRVLAHIANDKEMIQAFAEDMDIHTKTAVDVFHVREDEVTSLMRRTAKAVNFGIVYGISDYGLSQNLNITRKEAATFIEKYFESYPGVKAFMESIVKEAKKNGFVTTLLNRRRYLPEINSKNFNLRSFAERTAMNTPIQGTAADIIKKAMIRLNQVFKEKRLESKMLLQVHDELIFEVPKSELEMVTAIIKEEMEKAMDLRVPLKVEVSSGETWYDTK